MKDPIVTILTPTYNRQAKLAELYTSLCAQTSRNFLWLIVDDGSTDTTQMAVEAWRGEGKLAIMYVKKRNGGKHTALNCGIERVESPLTMIVDSDDTLLRDAVEIIEEDYRRTDWKGICGIAYQRVNSAGMYLSNQEKIEDGLRETFCQCRYGRGVAGDMAEVWLTCCLRQFPFPEFPGEKFLSEDAVWAAMAQKYMMIFRKQAVYVCDYAKDGLTVNRRAHNRQSPRGCMYRGEVHLKANLPVRYRCRAMLYYSVYGRVAGFSEKELFLRCRSKALYALAYIPGFLLYLYLR